MTIFIGVWRVFHAPFFIYGKSNETLYINGMGL
jgi:hypothetical protein